MRIYEIPNGLGKFITSELALRHLLNKINNFSKIHLKRIKKLNNLIERKWPNKKTLELISSISLAILLQKVAFEFTKTCTNSEEKYFTILLLPQLVRQENRMRFMCESFVNIVRSFVNLTKQTLNYSNDFKYNILVATNPELEKIKISSKIYTKLRNTISCKSKNINIWYFSADSDLEKSNEFLNQIADGKHLLFFVLQDFKKDFLEKIISFFSSRLILHDDSIYFIIVPETNFVMQGKLLKGQTKINRKFVMYGRYLLSLTDLESTINKKHDWASIFEVPFFKLFTIKGGK
ncbi:MAG: hypothetical protein ACTSSP_11535 [Candidatus Asgardarchaeia archaeon]